MKQTIYEIVVILIAIMLIGCEQEDNLVDEKCECELVKIEVTREWSNSIPIRLILISTEVRTPLLTQDCNEDGREFDNGTIECK